MVRETRHLWVGNLPENINEDRIKEHFKRYVCAGAKWRWRKEEEEEVECGSQSVVGVAGTVCGGFVGTAMWSV